MPSLSQITQNFFVTLINRLGVRPPPVEAFLLSNIVQPVSIVDADIAIPAFNTTPALGSAFSQGSVGAPAAATLLADTGQQVAGTYTATIMCASTLEGNGTTVLVQRRNAANAANVWEFALECGIQGCPPVFSIQVPLQLNERIRIVQGVQNGAAPSFYQCTIFLS